MSERAALNSVLWSLLAKDEPKWKKQDEAAQQLHWCALPTELLRIHGCYFFIQGAPWQFTRQSECHFDRERGGENSCESRFPQ